MKTRQEDIPEETEKQGDPALYIIHMDSATYRMSSTSWVSHIVQTCEHLAGVHNLPMAGVSEWNSGIQQRATSIMPYK